MRKKIMAFVFAVGLTLALAVPVLGGGGTVYAHAHQCNDGGAVPGPENCDQGEQGDRDGAGGDGPQND